MLDDSKPERHRFKSGVKSTEGDETKFKEHFAVAFKFKTARQVAISYDSYLKSDVFA